MRTLWCTLRCRATFDHFFHAIYRPMLIISKPCLYRFLFQVQARFVERRTREEFEKLHNFLQAEEEVRMEALRMDEEAKSQAMRQKIDEMTRNIASVSESIRALEEEIALEGISVLHVSF